MAINNDRPAYRVLAIHGFYGPDDHLYEEGECIYYDNEPNEEFEPLNEKARQAMTNYLTKLENQAREVAAKLNRPFIERPKTLDGALVFATEIQREKMAIMNAPKETKSIERVEVEETPETGQVKRGRGRPPGAKNKILAIG